MNALSIDVEEYYHGMEFEAAVPKHRRHLLPSRVEETVDRVLALLERFDTRATFFVVGKVAEAHREMVRKIASARHEIACHSYAHELVFRQSPRAFREDLRRAHAVLEDLAGGDVYGYRAPNYSIGPSQAWAYDILLEEGFRYDSSIYPVRHDRYGDPAAPRFPYIIHGDLIEFPIGTFRRCGLNFPIGGGGYFRLFPTSWFQRAIQSVNEKERKPVMFYFHPWEMDPEQPRPPMPAHHRFRHYVNLHRFESKVETLLSRVRFSPASEVLGLGRT
ncbi:MAG: XrtA system polysaccharide deacetylase [Vicinamibacteria bacterium]